MNKIRSPLDTAQASAANGFYVAPVACDENTVLAQPGTRFAARSAKWWRQWPDACIGIDLGRSKLVVIEIIAANAIQSEIARVLPPTPIVALLGDDIRRYFYRRGADQMFPDLIERVKARGSIRIYSDGIMMVPS